MKKILTHLTGIVFLISILIAGGCSPAVAPLEEGPKVVKIQFKVKKQNGEKHLKMHNAYKPDHKVVDTLETVVMPGDTVVWEKNRFLSRIKGIDSIVSVSQIKKIAIKAEQIDGTENYRFIIPKDAPYDTREKYDIVFTDRRDSTWTIDPYLRIPKKVRE